FAGALAAYVAENPALADHEHVGDELLVRRIGFGAGAQHEARSAGGEELVEVVLDVEGKAVEGAGAVEGGALDDQDVFRGHARLSGLSVVQVRMWDFVSRVFDALPFGSRLNKATPFRRFPGTSASAGRWARARAIRRRAGADRRRPAAEARRIAHHSRNPR